MISETINNEVFAITQDIFSALIDHEEGLLSLWHEAKPELQDPIFAWVDMDGNDAARALLHTERQTANELARALLFLDATDPVSDADLVDALGEVANVVGGNLKSLVPDPGTLSMPSVSDTLPTDKEAKCFGEVLMKWRGKILIISTWTLNLNAEGNN